jgi:hypothetical protein
MIFARRLNDAFGFVLALVVASLVLGALLPNEVWAAVLVSVSASAASIFAMTGSQARRVLVRSALWLGLVAIALAAIAAVSGERFWLDACALIQIVLVAGGLVAVLYRVITSTEIGSRTILGAISVYALLGILFAYIYVAVDLIQGGPFFTEVTHPGGSDFLFFSYSTLTTTGFGNLVPGGQPGRMFAGIEMVAGQIVLVTLVAGVVLHWRPGESLRRRLAERAES